MMETIIYRNAKKNKFTAISNNLLWNEKASLQAKGLLAIFLSNSNEWKINMKEIISRSKNGRDAHYKVVNELIELGYFARVQIVDPGQKKFEKMIYVFSDIEQEVVDEIENIKQWAIENKKDLIIEYQSKKIHFINEKKPHPENQETVNPETENQDINNTNSKNTNFNKTNLEEEEEISLGHVIAFLKEQIDKREITNSKTITAIYEVAEKCKAIGTTDKNAMENYCITIVEEKMKKFGQKQSQNKKGTSKKPTRSEIVPEWLEKQEYAKQVKKEVDEMIDIELKRDIEERLKKYKR